ncbi:MAG: hypothetical protein HRU21_05545 [Pseudomonadales bacterium]|nr:hypothetical protein [Pseudomonadales bacterium]
MKNFFVVNLYIQIYINRFIITILDKNERTETFFAEESFTTKRLLVGNFKAAEHCLSIAVKNIIPNSIIVPKKAAVVIQAMEMNEDGLCEVEERVLKELAYSSGAFKVFLHHGHALSSQEAVAIINGE